MLTASGCKSRGDSTIDQDSNLKAFVKTDNLWPTRTIPVCFTASVSPSDKETIKKRVTEGYKHTVLKFTEWSDCSSVGEHKSNNPYIRVSTRNSTKALDSAGIETDENAAGQSKLGPGVPWPLGGATLWLSTSFGQFDKRTTIHEFGHAIGLKHEHLRTDRSEVCDTSPLGLGVFGHEYTETTADSAINRYWGAYDEDGVMNYCGGSDLTATEIAAINWYYGNKPISPTEPLPSAPQRVEMTENIDHRILFTEACNSNQSLCGFDLTPNNQPQQDEHLTLKKGILTRWKFRRVNGGAYEILLRELPIALYNDKNIKLGRSNPQQNSTTWNLLKNPDATYSIQNAEQQSLYLSFSDQIVSKELVVSANPQKWSITEMSPVSLRAIFNSSVKGLHPNYRTPSDQMIYLNRDQATIVSRFPRNFDQLNLFVFDSPYIRTQHEFPKYLCINTISSTEFSTSVTNIKGNDPKCNWFLQNEKLINQASATNANRYLIIRNNNKLALDGLGYNWANWCDTSDCRSRIRDGQPPTLPIHGKIMSPSHSKLSNENKSGDPMCIWQLPNSMRLRVVACGTVGLGPLRFTFGTNGRLETQLKMGASNGQIEAKNYCLQGYDPKLGYTQSSLELCNDTNAQKWEFVPQSKQFKNHGNGKCLDARETMIWNFTTIDCDGASPSQKFEFIN